MYHKSRWFHRWLGVIGALFLLVIGVTGFLLATKGTVGWVRPPEEKGVKLESLANTVTLDQAAQAAFAIGLPKLAETAHIDRIDYRPKSNIFKVLSKEGYHEVQVDGTTGKVLVVNYRTDQLAEDIHDLSFFGDWMHDYWLPVVGVILTVLAGTGIGLFFTPVVRRWKNRKIIANARRGQKE
ncbi:MAG TPA: PepSY domain-containing protein [Fimbriimonadaceae bacterium]|nr:PepSY domain-containing protein [Fimbriimonadaceae bacterium]